MDAPKSTRVTELQSQVDDVKNVMSENVMRVMERGDRLENLDQRAESLQQSVNQLFFCVNCLNLVGNVQDVGTPSATKHVLQKFEVDHYS